MTAPTERTGWKCDIIQISPEGYNACPPRCVVAEMKSRKNETLEGFAARVGQEADRLADFTGLEYEWQVVPS